MEERISEMRSIIYKTLVDSSTIGLIGEREKVGLFTKLGIVKPKSEDIQLESLNTVYEPFYAIKGRYYIDYYRKTLYHLDIQDDVIELLVLDKTLKPKASKLVKLPGKEREVELEAEQRIIKKKSAYIILDQKGKEVNLEKFPVAPSEENTEKTLSEIQTSKIEITPAKAIEIFKSKIVERPGDVGRVLEEFFEVSEHTLIYVPIYLAKYKKAKTQEKKTISVNGITANLLPEAEDRASDTTNEKSCSKCGRTNDASAKFCSSCGHPF